jgi:hypothetical protein
MKEQYSCTFRGNSQEVYCNGEQHVTLVGDRFGKHPQRDSSPHAKILHTKCTCQKAKQDAPTVEPPATPPKLF